jgi:hypothetical protein
MKSVSLFPKELEMSRTVKWILLSTSFGVAIPLAFFGVRAATAQQPASPATVVPAVNPDYLGNATSGIPVPIGVSDASGNTVQFTPAAGTTPGQFYTNFFGQAAVHQAAPLHDEYEARTRKLVADYRNASNDQDKKKLVDDLAKAIETQFDVRQENRAKTLKQLEDQMKRLRDLHERRTREKNQIVQDRLRQLLRDADGVGWGEADTLGVTVPVEAFQAAEPVTAPFSTFNISVPAKSIPNP